MIGFSPWSVMVSGCEKPSEKSSVFIGVYGVYIWLIYIFFLNIWLIYYG